MDYDTAIIVMADWLASQKYDHSKSSTDFNSMCHEATEKIDNLFEDRDYDEIFIDLTNYVNYLLDN